ncbi:unnamed protein product, partial [marine sediment metagenome]
GIGMPIGGQAGTPTAVHTGLRYVRNQTSGDNTISLPALGSLPALETELQNRHSAAGWMGGTYDDGHLFQFEVSTAGMFILGAQTGWEDASGEETGPIKGVDIGFAVYDSAGTLIFTEQAETGEYTETKFQTLSTGIHQLHVFNGIYDDFALAGPDSQFTCWVTDLTEAVRRSPGSGADIVTGILSAGLVYDRALGGAGNPGCATPFLSGELTSTDVQAAIEENNDKISALETISNSLITAIRPYDIAGQIVGVPDDAAIVLRFIAARNFTIEQLGTVAMADVASTGTAVLEVERNGLPISLDITFTTSDTGVVEVPTAPVEIVIGDIITVIAPSPQDATLSDIEFTILGNIYPAPLVVVLTGGIVTSSTPDTWGNLGGTVAVTGGT